MLRCKQFSQSPNVVSQLRLHRGSTAECLVYSREVVVREVQRTRSLKIIQLLRERIGQARESANGLPNRHIGSFHVAGGYVARVWPSVAYLDYGFYHRRRRVFASTVVLAVVAIEFYHLREVGLSSENVLNSLAVEVESVSRDLEAMFRRDAISQACKELVRGFTIAFSNGVSWNQFSFSIERNEYPSISDFRRIFSFYVALLLLAVCPNLVRLNPFALEILHRHFHQLYAALTSENKQPHDRVAVQSSNAFCAANAGAFNQKLNRQKRLIFRHRHCAEQPFVIFGVRLATLRATKPLQSVAVLPKLPAFELASTAFHKLKIQQPLAVCQAKRRCNNGICVGQRRSSSRGIYAG